uniref:Uncharacterized protein n=1 Tax=Rhizophora mucronata TaxID=61149 RepID=A0A2P2ND49_RHIMU
MMYFKERCMALNSNPFNEKFPRKCSCVFVKLLMVS